MQAQAAEFLQNGAPQVRGGFLREGIAAVLA
jgi:hypothetical protein